MRRFSDKHNFASFLDDRLTILSIVIFLCSAVIFLRLLQLQVFQHERYSLRAEDQHVVQKQLDPNRGSIYIHDYQASQTEIYPVAINKKFYEVFAVPDLIKNPVMSAKLLAPVLELEAEEEKSLAARLSKEKDIYEPIKRKIEEDKKKEIEALALPGIKFNEEIFRYYPEGENIAQVTGFVGFKGDNLVGQYGLEEYFQKPLAGEKGFFTFERDASGRLIPLARRVKAEQENGADLVLTLDRSIQFTACNSLKQSVQKYGAEDGSVIIMDPKTGAILAMCGYPSFDPNNYNSAPDYKVYNNYNVSEPYEPGSMLKGITMAAAVDVGAVTPATTYDDTGSVEIAGYTLRNSDLKAHGIKNMTQVLEESLNTGAIFAAQQIGLKLFRDYFERFGFGQKTGIQLVNEKPGNISSLKKPGEIFLYTASYGQGITATPLQIVAAFAAIANGGKLMKPYVVDEVRYANGKIDKTEPQFIRQVISSKTATTLSAMLASVVKSGHTKGAQIPGYYIAGKTGTAEVAEPGKAGYSADKTIHSFIGFAPIEDPKFVMLVKLNHPKDVRFAESTAVPVFGEIAQFLLNYLHVPPSYGVNENP